jgi:hypothetical protein
MTSLTASGYLVDGGNNSLPARRWAAVTPSNTVDLPLGPCRGLWCEVAGTLALVGEDDVVVVFTVEAKQIYPLGPKRVNATSTTATGITALYGE